MNFLEHIFDKLRAASDRPVLQEARAGGLVSIHGSQFMELVGRARGFLRGAGLRAGDRCALLAPNSIHWVALDLALMAEGIVVVPLYSRQAARELAAILRDAEVSLLCCEDPALGESLSRSAPAALRTVLLEDIFEDAAPYVAEPPAAVPDLEPVTIIYTSGTSGEPKGVVLTASNLNHMLWCTASRLDALMEGHGGVERVFHYLPFNFAGSWILLLTCLSRKAVLTLSMDLNRLTEELREADPHYFLNVPTLLERIRRGIEEKLEKRFVARSVFRYGQRAWERMREDKEQRFDSLRFSLADSLVLQSIRKKFPRELCALICGSAPLAVETQLFFMMLGMPVLQVYGLTETTAICTMDHPQFVEPGRVGPAIPGVEMKLGTNQEIFVRGPNVFSGYWKRPQETAKVLRDGWFTTGDQGEMDASGNWRIIGRIKNLIILNSGHNIAPEPIEEMLEKTIPGAQQVVLIGNGRGYLTAIVTGPVEDAAAETAIELANAKLPHYKQIRAFHVEHQPFTIESGLLTVNGKLRRDAIAAKFAVAIEKLYQRSEHGHGAAARA